MRSKTKLLARVSTLAIIAAAGMLGPVQQAEAAGCTSTFHVPADGTTVPTATEWTCVEVDAPVDGDVTNKAKVGNPGPGYTPFFVGKSITGVLTNKGTIYGGGAGGAALLITDDASVGSILNDIAGSISSDDGNALQIGETDIEFSEDGFVLNGITNRNTITSGNGAGIAALEGTLAGGLTNELNATISGGLAGVFIGGDFDSWSGGIHNSGQISGFGGGIAMNEGDLLFSGGIHNYATGVIESSGGAGIAAYDVDQFEGGVHNAGSISGYTFGVYIDADDFDGDFDNSGEISGGGTAVYLAGDLFKGDITNTGVINGETGKGLVIDVDVLQGPSGVGPATIRNANHIQGNWAGVAIYGDEIVANFENTPQDFPDAPPAIIEANDGTGVIIAPDFWTGDVTNNGTIRGTTFGLVIGATFTEGANYITDNFSGAITNNGLIQGTTEEGGGADGLYLSFETFNGSITNNGTIQGDQNGLKIVGHPSSECYFCNEGVFNGSIENTGTIAGANGDGVAATLANYNGNFTNSGDISGGIAGVRFEGIESDTIFSNKFTGDFHNQAGGSITGGDVGVAISFGTIEGDFINDGSISGGITGASIAANTFTGDIINNGVINGADELILLAEDPALVISMGSMVGDIVNNGTLSAFSNALSVTINNLDGQITNTGLIEATGGSPAVALNIGNGTTFTNTDDGLILGDVLFGGKAPYEFIAENGGVEGDVTGQTGFDFLNNPVNDDNITVQNGEHYFFAGKASNFASFNVGEDGVAVMGSRGVGDTDHSGAYSFANVGDVNVGNGGTLYIDSSTTLVAQGNYDQNAGGTLMFFLGAPEGLSSASGVVVAGEGDYGRLIVNGTATLNGTIAGFLDPDFGSASPGVTEVQYNDVIEADAISGDFTATALISDSAIFELNSILDDNTVDLRVLRAPLGQTSTVSNVVNTNDPFDANIADRTNGMGGGCGGIAGAGWCFNRYAANEPGATQVMTDATPGEDPFTWLRAGGRKVGETAVWGRAVGVWGDTDGEATIPGSEFSLGGAIAGVDHVFTKNLLAGLAVQWTTTDVDFDLGVGDAQIDSLEIGAYGSYAEDQLYLNANLSYIWHDFDVTRFVGPNFANGNYDGSTISAYAEAGKTFMTDGGVRIQPLVALSYSHLETDSYAETGTAVLLDVLDDDQDSLKSVIGARFAYPFQTGGGMSMVPEARIAWSHEFMDDRSSHLADVQGGPFNPQLVTGEKFSRDTLILGAGVTASLSDTTSVFLDYDAGLNTDVSTHTVSAGFRTRW